jgi:hypothetical protein
MRSNSVKIYIILMLAIPIGVTAQNPVGVGL